jgi:predicted aspartyl protease
MTGRGARFQRKPDVGQRTNAEPAMAGNGWEGYGSPLPMPATQFAYARHLLTVPVVVNGTHETRFVLDTGIGLTLLSTTLAETLGCTAASGTYTGRRMSGQAVTLPIVRLGRLELGECEQADVPVGLFDMSVFPPELDGVEGFLSLAFFRTTPFTLDYGAGEIVLETDGSLAARRERGTTLPLSIEDDGHAISVYLPLTIPGGTSISVEVDSGSDELILDEALAARVGVSLDDDGVRRVDGTDETGHAYERYFARLPGSVHPTGAPDLTHDEPAVMFQRIIHDGLIGDAFLRRFVATFDVAGGEMILAPLR